MSFKTLALAAMIATLPALASAQMMIEDAYARSSGPSAPTGAAFMTITNHSQQDDVITGVTSEAAVRVELHTHLEGENGVMRMVHVEDGFPIAAGETIALERGGKHVMFMGLAAPMEQDGEVEVTFSFEHASPVTVIIPVDLDRQPAHGGDMNHGDMDHGDMNHGDMNHGEMENTHSDH